MKIQKTVTIELSNEELESFHVMLRFCNMEFIVKNPLTDQKGYNYYELQSAYDLYGRLLDL